MYHINVCGDHIPKSDKIKLLGIWLDINLNLKHHINLKCRMAILIIQKLKHFIKCIDPRCSQINCPWDGNIAPQLCKCTVLQITRIKYKEIAESLEFSYQDYTQKDKIREL